ncbi:Adaptor protein complex 4 subunit sigma [Guillardia theta CCMP2712]|uniref:AP complex subunit sigma n=1 Tax=Guillardia theta (strain CCMP2712) TaxID=905079 RepID=L1JUA6_GUITC|nr:Adaptor protein complex 4 subunit sigma [Guillardia theta CCMP2712]EKX51884.1 Adaptor protein complex 4 subunit sigma [Guillardia theta CCMP2712]|eukprot:XP_005838864.1 Adaptor protein complex 4 subunit sigma [Guillardia theta CCMP2712]
MIKFLIVVNKQGQTRLARYYEERRDLTVEERSAQEADIVRRCLMRGEQQCSFLEYKGYNIAYRRYASLFFIVGADEDENELAILELIHALVETLDRFFENVCELDIMSQLDKAHFIVDEMILNGCVVETNKNIILEPINVLDKS